MTEEARMVLANDLNKNIDYSTGYYDPSIQIVRSDEQFEEKLPSVVMQFLPTSERKFDSISNIIDVHEDDPDFFVFGYCELEALRIFVQERDVIEDYNYHGRILVDRWARKILWRIRRDWDNILRNYGASIELGMPPRITDLSGFVHGTQKYVNEILLYIRTSHIWDERPSADSWESGVKAEDANVYMDDDAPEGGTKTLDEYDSFGEVDT